MKHSRVFDGSSSDRPEMINAFLELCEEYLEIAGEIHLVASV